MFLAVKSFLSDSVVDPGWLSRILICFHPRSNNNKKEEGRKKFVVAPFWVAIHFTEFKNILFFKRYGTTRFLNHLTKNFSNFNPKIVTKLPEIWVGDPRSGIKEKKFPDPDQGVKKTPDPGS
jgi:hypothetical protein